MAFFKSKLFYVPQIIKHCRCVVLCIHFAPLLFQVEEEGNDDNGEIIRWEELGWILFLPGFSEEMAPVEHNYTAYMYE